MIKFAPPLKNGSGTKDQVNSLQIALERLRAKNESLQREMDSLRDEIRLLRSENKTLQSDLTKVREAILDFIRDIRRDNG